MYFVGVNSDVVVFFEACDEMFEMMHPDSGVFVMECTGQCVSGDGR